MGFSNLLIIIFRVLIHFHFHDRPGNRINCHALFAVQIGFRHGKPGGATSRTLRPSMNFISRMLYRIPFSGEFPVAARSDFIHGAA